jgi:exopolyphosphatase/pppGpp-phosphohydrolase
VTPGPLHVVVADRSIEVELIGGGTWSLPVGPLTLVENELERAVRPAPAQLTNALGIVSDHLDDVVRESPMVLDAASVVIGGPHAIALACVELGADSVPDGYTLGRSDADEVFRTLVAEPIPERLHNPGLRPDHVESIIGTCCVVLAVMRRLELTRVAVEPRES